MARKNKDEYNAYMKVYVLERYHRRRQEAIVEFGGECAKCGNTNSLEFDHVIPADKTFTIAKLWSLNDKTYRLELKKCQLLCHDCHLIKSSTEGSFGNSVRDTQCRCGKEFTTTKSFAGHRAWCKV